MSLLRVVGSHRSIFFFIFISIAAAGGFSARSFADPAEQEIAVRVDEARALLRTLDEARDRELSDTIKQLKNYAFQPVPRAMLGVIGQQFRQPRPNLYVIDAALEVLAELGNAPLSPDFEVLMQFWTANVLPPLLQDANQRNRASAVSVQFAAVNNAMHQKIEALPGFGNEGSFESLLEENARPGSPESIILSTTVDFMSDTVPEANEFVISDREPEADRTIDTLVRMKGKNPTLIGPQGSGKTTVVQRVVQKIRAKDYPGDPAYQEVLDESFVLQTSPGRISRLAKSDAKASQMAAIEMFFDSILSLEKKYKKKIIVYIDEAHTLEEAQAEAMLTYMDSARRGVSLIMSATSKRFQNAFKDNEPFLRRCEQIPVEEFSRDQVLKSIGKSWQPSIEKKYGVLFSPELVEVVVNQAPTLLPESGRFDGSIKLLQDMAIRAIRDGKKGTTLNEDDGYAFLRSRLRFPINPHDGIGFKAYLDGLKDRLNQDVVGQPRMVGDLVDLWGDVLQDNDRGLRVGVALGPTGIGKSLFGRAFAQEVFGNPRAFFEIDGNTYKTGGLSLNSLFGAPNGVISSDKTSGTLMDWLDDPAQGKFGGMIFINEGERAHEDFWERFMEFFDTGKLSGGDGKPRRAVKHIVVLTSNRGDTILFPPNVIDKWSVKELQDRTRDVTAHELKDLFVRTISGDDEFKVPGPVLQRIDKYTVAKPMLKPEVMQILTNMATQLQDETLTEMKINLVIEPAVLEFLANALYVIRDGVRPAQREIAAILKNARTQALGNWNVERGGTIQMKLDASDRAHPKLRIEKNGEAEPVIVDLPKPPLDPMDDPEFLDKIMKLEDAMNQRVFGQTAAIHSIAQAAIAHFLNPEQNQHALSVVLVSSTGVGKTETGRALAQALFGDARRCEVVSLNGIIYEGELNNVLGVPAGHVGSTGKASIRAFEQFLMNNPKGGVLVWDEFSNLGGKDPAQKEALIKKFYGITDEKYWISPQTNERYDLSKHIFLWTGNDGEKLFQGITADEVRMVVYEQNHGREKVRELLRASGVPEAFIGRMADAILYKPLVRSEAVKVVKKHLDPVLEQYLKYGIKITASDEFEDQFAKTFFTQDEGGRSVRKVVDNRVRSILSQAVVEVRKRQLAEGSAVLNGLTIDLELDDSLTDKAFVPKGAPPRKVFFRVVAKKGEVTVLDMKEDVTEFSSYEPRPLFENAAPTAWHEAGHAVINDSKVTGQKTTFITILPGGTTELKYLGLALYKKDPEEFGRNFTREAALRHIARLYAGQKATELAGYPRDAGWNNDLGKIRDFARRYFLEFGLDPEFEGVLVGTSDGKITDQFLASLSAPMRESLEKKTRALIREAELLAERELVKKWDLVRVIVAQLLKTGNVSEKQFDGMVEDFNKKRALRAGAAAASSTDDAPRWRVDQTEAGPRAVRCRDLLASGQIVMKF